MKTLLIFWSVVLSAGAVAKDIKTVSFVDIQKYQGTWYEIAAIPQPFEQGCTCSQANYAASSAGLSVENSCRREGKWSSVQGSARIVDKETNAKLKVQFPPGPEGDYWIIDLDSDYRYALITNAEGTSLWILSRERELDAKLTEELLAKAEAQGIDISTVKTTDQSDCR